MLQIIWDFIQNQLLGMAWLNDLIGRMLFSFGLKMETVFIGALQFFIFDVIKIFTLLCVLIFTISYIQSFFPPERTKRILGKFNGLTANAMGALLGTLTPFCSCSSIPLFIGFTGAGLPLGVTFSFLISSPLVDIGAVILLVSIFGGKIAIAYVLVGLILAIVGGAIIEKLHMENQVADFIRFGANNKGNIIDLSIKERLEFARDSLWETFKKVWPYVIIGVAIGAAIHNFIPQSFIENVLGNKNPFSVLLATAIGAPVYADIFGTIPIAEALHNKGVGIGTVISFMMAVTTLSIPSIILLKQAIKPKLLGVFIIIVVVGIIIIGYLFNMLEGIIF